MEAQPFGRARRAAADADALTIDDYLIEHPSQTVLIRVKGDSMMDAGIFDGDLVVVDLELRRSEQRRVEAVLRPHDRVEIGPPARTGVGGLLLQTGAAPPNSPTGLTEI